MISGKTSRSAARTRWNHSDMRLTDILTEDRVRVTRHQDGIKVKSEVLEALSLLLASGTGQAAELIHKTLTDRESLQSTGIGDGVAIPHGSLEALVTQTAAIVLCPDGVDFHSIDGRPAKIFVGVIGPRGSTGEHLRMLARISRLLRDGNLRDRLLEASDGTQAFDVIVEEERGRP
ncbi:MAG TPA: PTS sugar transporter subunit IIA [Polyangiaceae bacterium]|nr:PTS sugar transporter subunit IIA [Polyangiaceae bacterium]HQB42307.1 PTS sugar transporter subunit IIA [Polyangiaceae bacterium]HQK16546.1 PTS sugar transporter subunit IIA [Polyangiaceae bacterium]